MSHRLLARRTAAGLMLLSGVTHLIQLLVYPPTANVIGAALFGLLYLVIGLLLSRPGRLGLWLGATFPAIGGALGIYRFFNLHVNPFTPFHVLIDILVIVICIYHLRAARHPAG